MVEVVTFAPSAGLVMTMTGAIVSTVTLIDAVPVLPAASVSDIVMVLEPSTRVTALVLAVPSEV